MRQTTSYATMLAKLNKGDEQELMNTILSIEFSFRELTKSMNNNPALEVVIPGQTYAEHNLGTGIAMSSWKSPEKSAIIQEYIKQKLEQLQSGFEGRVKYGHIGKQPVGEQKANYHGEPSTTLWHLWGADRGNFNSTSIEGKGQASFECMGSKNSKIGHSNRVAVGIITMPCRDLFHLKFLGLTDANEKVLRENVLEELTSLQQNQIDRRSSDIKTKLEEQQAKRLRTPPGTPPKTALKALPKIAWVATTDPVATTPNVTIKHYFPQNIDDFKRALKNQKDKMLLLEIFQAIYKDSAPIDILDFLNGKDPDPSDIVAKKIFTTLLRTAGYGENNGHSGVDFKFFSEELRLAFFALNQSCFRTETYYGERVQLPLFVSPHADLHSWTVNGDTFSLTPKDVVKDEGDLHTTNAYKLVISSYLSALTSAEEYLSSKDQNTNLISKLKAQLESPTKLELNKAELRSIQEANCILQLAGAEKAGKVPVLMPPGAFIGNKGTKLREELKFNDGDTFSFFILNAVNKMQKSPNKVVVNCEGVKLIEKGKVTEGYTDKSDMRIPSDGYININLSEIDGSLKLTRLANIAGIDPKNMAISICAANYPMSGKSFAVSQGGLPDPTKPTAEEVMRESANIICPENTRVKIEIGDDTTAIVGTTTMGYQTTFFNSRWLKEQLIKIDDEMQNTMLVQLQGKLRAPEDQNFDCKELEFILQHSFLLTTEDIDSARRDQVLVKLQDMSEVLFDNLETEDKVKLKTEPDMYLAYLVLNANEILKTKNFSTITPDQKQQLTELFKSDTDAAISASQTELAKPERPFQGWGFEFKGNDIKIDEEGKVYVKITDIYPGSSLKVTGITKGDYVLLGNKNEIVIENGMIKELDVAARLMRARTELKVYHKDLTTKIDLQSVHKKIFYPQNTTYVAMTHLDKEKFPIEKRPSAQPSPNSGDHVVGQEIVEVVSI